MQEPGTQTNCQNFASGYLQKKVPSLASGYLQKVPALFSEMSRHPTICRPLPSRPLNSREIFVSFQQGIVLSFFYIFYVLVTTATWQLQVVKAQCLGVKKLGIRLEPPVGVYTCICRAPYAVLVINIRCMRFFPLPVQIWRACSVHLVKCRRESVWMRMCVGKVRESGDRHKLDPFAIEYKP